MKPNPQADWTMFKLLVLVAPAVLLVVSAVLGQWTTTFPLSVFGVLAALVIVLRGDRGRAITLHLLIGGLVVYQALLLRATIDEPNIGIAWFTAVPATVALLGQRSHILVWTPVSLLLIVYCWSLYAHYPVMAHPMTLPNLLGVTLVVSASAFGVITQRARRESALNTALDELRQEILDRERAQAEARQADAAVSTFFGSMSHELRTPLTSIVLSTDALDNTLVRKEQKVWTRNIRQSADSLVLLLNDILDLARGDAGAAALRYEDFDVEELIESVRAIVQPVARRRDMCLFVGAMPDAPLRWSGDPARIRQVLVNLVNNALIHSRGTRVFVQASLQDEHLRFVVGDNGIGIDAQDHERIFRPFQQLGPRDDDSTVAPSGSSGTGLGLSIARDFVTAMGAQLTLESQRDAGAVFSFTLPPPSATHAPGRDTALASRYPARDGWPEAVWLEAPCEHALDWGGAWLRHWGVALAPDAERIDLVDQHMVRIGSARGLANRLTAAGHLDAIAPTVAVEPYAASPDVVPAAVLRLVVCDDDPQIQQIIGETLTLAGHEAACVGTGDALLGYLAEHEVDGVVLDVNLAGESGVDVLQRVRSLPGAAGATPVCMLSGAWNHRERCIAAGADDYLLKPSSGEEIIATIERLAHQNADALTEEPTLP